LAQFTGMGWRSAAVPWHEITDHAQQRSGYPQPLSAGPSGDEMSDQGIVHLKGSTERGWKVFEGETLVGWFTTETAARETAHELLRTRQNPFRKPD
jgi:hypothetical protein